MRLCRNRTSKTCDFVLQFDFSDIHLELIHLSSYGVDENLISPLFQQKQQHSLVLTGKSFNQPTNTNNIYHTDDVKTSAQQRHLSFDTIKTT